MEGRDLERKDSMGNTPLAWAAKSGHEEVVRELLRRDDIDPTSQGRTAKHHYAWLLATGTGVVKILLGWDDVDPDKPGEDSQTPLLLAAYYGHEGVKILLGRDDVNLDKSNEYCIHHSGKLLEMDMRES